MMEKLLNVRMDRDVRGVAREIYEYIIHLPYFGVERYSKIGLEARVKDMIREELP